MWTGRINPRCLNDPDDFSDCVSTYKVRNAQKEAFMSAIDLLMLSVSSRGGDVGGTALNPCVLPLPQLWRLTKAYLFLDTNHLGLKPGPLWFTLFEYESKSESDFQKNLLGLRPIFYLVDAFSGFWKTGREPHRSMHKGGRSVWFHGRRKNHRWSRAEPNSRGEPLWLPKQESELGSHQSKRKSVEEQKFWWKKSRILLCWAPRN